AHLFDERDQAVRRMIAQVIATANGMGKPIGICGQAPSDYPGFAGWLVEQGIGSISLNPDSVIKTTLVVSAAEEKTNKLGARKGASIGQG
ncbi:MAG TPA: putative PEP-binding protein, partial [Blastocatellia bacterium]|nr:putative PEP-binding protein [Blastocatellia bacterium]